MNILSLVSLFLLGLGLVIFTILLPVAIIFNTVTGMKYREKLAERINRLRLGEMLVALGIDIDTYLLTVCAVDIRRQMERCTKCTHTEDCDDKLAKGKIEADAIGFCNNEGPLREMAGRPKG